MCQFYYTLLLHILYVFLFITEKITELLHVLEEKILVLKLSQQGKISYTFDITDTLQVTRMFIQVHMCRNSSLHKLMTFAKPLYCL